MNGSSTTSTISMKLYKLTVFTDAANHELTLMSYTHFCILYMDDLSHHISPVNFTLEYLPIMGFNQTQRPLGS